MKNNPSDKPSPPAVFYVSITPEGKKPMTYFAQTIAVSANSGLAIIDTSGQAIFVSTEDWKNVEIQRPEVLTKMTSFLRTNGEIELVTEDGATASLATEARLNGRATDFTYWDGRRTRKLRGVVTSLSTGDGPLRFTVLPKA